MIRKICDENDVLLIADEVMTGFRFGLQGAQGFYGVQPDLTTLGKFIGGGLPTGAFGGKAEFMEHYNPKKKGAWNHAGTFNNNVCSMAAGAAGIGEIYTQQRATHQTRHIAFTEVIAEQSHIVCILPLR